MGNYFDKSIFLAAGILITLGMWTFLQIPEEPTIQLPLFSGTPLATGDADNPHARAEWEQRRLADPNTGQIPANSGRAERAFKQDLQSQLSNYRMAGYDLKSVGPYNVGGRTRALVIDASDENILIAGGVSSGIWRSEDQGASWTKVTAPNQRPSITCITQDTRPGKTNIWYAGSGEAIGNSANAGFSAPYLGDGMLKSIDGGQNWFQLDSTVSNTPEFADAWDRMWRLAIDPSNLTEDEVYAAAAGRIFRSMDGGNSWDEVLGGVGLTSLYTDIAVTSSGVVYAAFNNGGGQTAGIWRSTDGSNWTEISPSFFPGATNRIVLSIDPNDEDRIYFLANTPGSGLMTNVFFGGTEWNSLWRYNYLSGDGAGANGIWADLSLNLPNGFGDFGNFNVQGSYNMMVAVKPGDPNTVFVGGTNLYRSTSGFTDSTNTSWIGGYEPFTTLPYFEIYDQHHPDQHHVTFLPSNPDVLFSASDGGVARTDDCDANTVSWTTLNNGYVSSQLYTIAIDHGTDNSNEITCGLQDNGSWWSNSADPNFIWTMPSTGDGAHCAIENGGGFHYFSRQRGKMLKVQLDNAGIPTAFTRIDPVGGTDYMFINPYILDPIDNQVMYLSEGAKIWRNDDLSQIALNNQYDSISTGWFLNSDGPPSGLTITAMAASVTPAHRLYYGTANKRIFRVDNAHTGDPVHQEITSNIAAGGYTDCIAVDPRDADKLIVVFSNYNTYSLYYSDNGGTSWTGISGNMEAEPPIGAPPGLGLGSGPSVRSAAILPVAGGKTVFLLGTSVGLFATDTLMGDSTFWYPQAGNTIGNAVVDVIDTRPSDGFVAIGTHGNGVYTGNITSTNGIDEGGYIPVGVAPATAKLESVNVYPNPTSGATTVSFSLAQQGKVTVTLSDELGRPVAILFNGDKVAGAHQIPFETAALASGLYYCTVADGQYATTKKLIVKN